MLFLTHTMLPAFALAAMMSVAQAQTATDQDHTAHHPDGATTTQPQPGASGNAPMMGGMMGQPDGQSGMMGNMGVMMPWFGTGLSPLAQWLVVPALAFRAVWPRSGAVTGSSEHILHHGDAR